MNRIKMYKISKKTKKKKNTQLKLRSQFIKSYFNKITFLDIIFTCTGKSIIVTEI